MARLTNIHIKNYRSIRDSGAVPVTKLFAVIGKNNTGKSSFLKAIQILLGGITEIHPHDFHKGASPIEICGTLERWESGVKIEKNLKVICEMNDKPKLVYYLNEVEKSSTTYLKIVPPLLLIPDRRDSAEFSTAGQKTTILKRILNTRKVVDEERLVAVTKELEDLKRKEAEEVSKILTAKFREITQEQGLEVKIEPEIDIAKSTTHSSALFDGEIENAPIVGLTESGTGVQSLYLLALLDTYGDITDDSDDAILIIEEPEVYLHPAYQRCMFDAMRKIASENQVIFSTHSPIMISQIWLTDDTPSVRQVRIEAGETKIEPVEVSKVISELGIRYEDVLNPQLTVFVEGEGDEAFYKKLGIVGGNIVYIPTDGFRAMHYFAYMKIISSTNVSSTFIVIADSDGENQDIRRSELRRTALEHSAGDSTKLAERLDSDGAIYVLEKYAIESYFINAETLSSAFPDIANKDIQQLVTHYHSIYDEELRNLRDSTHALTLQQFQKYARPKLIFTRSDRKGDSKPEFEEAYNIFWRNDPDFIRVRELILAACEKKGTEGTNWFDHVLENANLNAHVELTNIHDAITSSLQ